MGVTQEMYCETCAAVTPFEECFAIPLPTAPPIDDADHDDCPEWACIRCGEAVVLAPLTPVAAA